MNPPPIIVDFPPRPQVADHLPLRRRVIKLGGSLLELRDLIARLRTWVARQSVAQNYLVVGGGDRVEAVRQVRDRWDDQAAHWHCLELMDRNAREVGEAWPGAVVQQRWPEIMAPGRPEFPVPPVTLLLAAQLLRHPPPCLKRRGELPIGWHVTSDSVAAYLAILLEADELVLLKSTSAQRPTPAEWASDAFVDAYFPQLARHLPRIAAVNLRHPFGGPPNGV